MVASVLLVASRKAQPKGAQFHPVVRLKMSAQIISSYTVQISIPLLHNKSERAGKTAFLYFTFEEMLSGALNGSQ